MVHSLQCLPSPSASFCSHSSPFSQPAPAEASNAVRIILNSPFSFRAAPHRPGARPTHRLQQAGPKASRVLAPPSLQPHRLLNNLPPLDKVPHAALPARSGQLDPL